MALDFLDVPSFSHFFRPLVSFLPYYFVLFFCVIRCENGNASYCISPLTSLPKPPYHFLFVFFLTCLILGFPRTPHPLPVFPLFHYAETHCCFVSCYSQHDAQVADESDSKKTYFSSSIIRPPRSNKCMEGLKQVNFRSSTAYTYYCIYLAHFFTTFNFSSLPVTSLLGYQTLR